MEVDHGTNERRRIIVSGVVQGVGFRPFVHRLASNVALSGGTFQNLRMHRSVGRELASLGFGVLTHRRVPPNDGGISFGQAAIAARRVD